MAERYALSLILWLLIINSWSVNSAKDILKQGSSLHVENPADVLVSPDGNFTAGFHKVGDNSYCFAIWFTDDPSSCPSNCTLVWMANRDTPVNGRRSKLSLLRTGNLVLTDASRTIVWSTNTNSTNSLLSLTLLDTGNLVLVGPEGMDGFLWQSFDSPTDTLLPLQPLVRHSTLVSSRSRTDFSSGFYKLSFDEENILIIIYDSPEFSSAFWPVDHSVLPRDIGRASYNSSRTAVLDRLGNFTSSDNFSFVSSDYGVIRQRRLTLDFDGNLRLYSRENGSSNWVVSWQAISDACTIHGTCGPNSFCSYLPRLARRTCSCLPGFTRDNETDWSLGCKPVFDNSFADDADQVSFLALPNVESNGYDFGYYLNTTLDECKKLCTQRLDCKGFQFKFIYRTGPENIPYCFPKIELRNGYLTPDFRGVLHLKLPKNRSFSDTLTVDVETSLPCPNVPQKQPLQRIYQKGHTLWSLQFLVWFVSGVGIFELLAVVLAWHFLIRTHEKDDETAQFALLSNTGFRRFTYAELKKATRNFKEEIGRGASGIVYKGVLADDRVAAIKRLYESEQGEAEFLAEASTIGRLNHMHLIEMWGYCAEGRERILVYEYMEHGSLSENLSLSKQLDWKKRYEIAFGTAKGLAYLHEECLEWVLHCDLKPQNILLDLEFRPKVSDFGLSKLINRSGVDNSSFSRIRGTRGYMAPEWVYSPAITSKVDVYSYGIVVLEMITGMSPTGIPGLTVSQHGTLVSWLRERITANEGREASWIEEIVDPDVGSTTGDDDMNKIELLVKVALQCVEEDMNARPSMSQVVQMLLCQK